MLTPSGFLCFVLIPSKFRCWFLGSNPLFSCLLNYPLNCSSLSCVRHLLKWLGKPTGKITWIGDRSWWNWSVLYAETAEVYSSSWVFPSLERIMQLSPKPESPISPFFLTVSYYNASLLFAYALFFFYCYVFSILIGCDENATSMWPFMKMDS